MDDLAYIGRLKKTQEQFLEENLKTQESRTKLLDDYKRLKERLKTLPDTVSQPAMVPIGDVAFFPGTIVHTNEIMVLLGDNWFVERSAKQATQIVDRRMKLVAKQLDDLKKEYEHIKSNLDYTSQFEQLRETGNVKEIKEELPPGYEENRGKKRVAHRAKHDKIPKSVSFQTNQDFVQHLRDNLPVDDEEAGCTIDHDELMLRLNQLEREEQEAEALQHETIMKELLKGVPYKPPNSTTTSHQGVGCSKEETLDATCRKDEYSNQARHVKFQNVPNCIHDINEVEIQRIDNVIHFEHTNLQRERSVSESDLQKCSNASSSQFNSPADLYEHFSMSRTDIDDNKPLKSILKKDSRSGSSENLRLKPILKTSPEYRPGTPENSLDEPQSILKTPPDTQISEKRPGTPENTLDNTTHSILKTSVETCDEVYIDHDLIDDESQIRPILKGYDLVQHQQQHQAAVRMRVSKPNELNTTTNFYSSSDDKRSILKNHDPLLKRTNTENTLLNDGDHESRRSILTSPDSLLTRSKNVMTLDASGFEQPKPILKNTDIQNGATAAAAFSGGNSNHSRKEAFSGVVVERSRASNCDDSKEEKNPKKKPMSKFKASRMKK